MQKQKCQHGLLRGLCAVCASKRKRQEYEELVHITGRSVEELDEELTAPDPDADAPLTVAESHAAEGTWSQMCCHGRHVDACWECMV